MKHKIDDYVIVSAKEGKPFLGKVSKIGDETLTVVPDKLRYHELREVEVPKITVMLNLGTDPVPGTVYGVDVANRYRRSITHPFWGSIHFFVKPSKEHLQMLKIGLDFTAKKLDDAGLGNYTDRFQTEIRAAKGKYAGMYKHSNEDGRSLVWYAPEQADTQDAMNYIIFHEYGHVLRYHGLTRVKARARWQRLFQQSIAPVVVSKKWLDRCLGNIKGEEDPERNLGSIFKDYVGDDEENMAYLKALTRWFRQIHHVSPKDLEVLWGAGDKATIESLWPTSSIDTSKLKPLISDYATRNVEETFAESFAFHMQGKKLPSHVTSLLEKSLTIIKDAA